MSNLLNIFVSSYVADGSYCAFLIQRLRSEGFFVAHSTVKNDVRWNDWYTSKLDEELNQTNVFIICLDESWDSSTWMAHEADQALQLYKSGHLKGYFYLNPLDLEIRAAGMIPYLLHRLPSDMEQLVTEIKKYKE